MSERMKSWEELKKEAGTLSVVVRDLTKSEVGKSPFACKIHELRRMAESFAARGKPIAALRLRNFAEARARLAERNASSIAERKRESSQ